MVSNGNSYYNQQKLCLLAKAPCSQRSQNFGSSELLVETQVLHKQSRECDSPAELAAAELSGILQEAKSQSTWGIENAERFHTLLHPSTIGEPVLMVDDGN